MNMTTEYAIRMRHNKVMRIFLLLLFMIVALNMKAQLNAETKRNLNWSIGYEPALKFDFNGAINIDTFLSKSNTTPPICALSAPAGCISDTFGNLLTFTNGFILYDKDGFGVENGIYLNCPKGTLLADHYGGNSPFTQNTIILPKKGGTYYIIGVAMSDSVADNYLNHIVTEFDILDYSIVDMNENSGKGKVIVKNGILLENQHYSNSSLTAVKHGNGKDWWLIKTDCTNNRYQLFLVTEDTIAGPYYQYRSDTNFSYCFFFGQVYFSQDGSKMASSVYGNEYTDSSLCSLPNNYRYHDPFSGNTYVPNRVDLYDFDRCQGTLTYKNHYVVPIDTSTYPGYDFKSGISFSPDGNLLYMSSNYSIYQIDLNDTNRLNGILISGPDTVMSAFPWYAEMSCAPDGKLYIGNFGGTRKFMSYINNPNIKGMGCNFVANGIWQPYTNLLNPPNMPNYGLGKAPISSTCWPVVVSENMLHQQQFEIFPNPAQEVINIKILSSEFIQEKCELFNSLGQLVTSIKIFDNKLIRMNLTGLSKGVYYLKVGNEIKKVTVE